MNKKDPVTTLNSLVKDATKEVLKKNLDKETFMETFGDEMNDLIEQIKSNSYKRVLYSNWDVYMYHVHKKSFGTLQYKGIVYDGDIESDRYKLITMLLVDKVIVGTRKDKYVLYHFIDSQIIHSLQKVFLWDESRNRKMNRVAIFLNLRSIFND